MMIEREEFNRFADDTRRSLDRIEARLEAREDRFLTRRDASVWAGAVVGVVVVLKFLKVL